LVQYCQTFKTSDAIAITVAKMKKKRLEMEYSFDFELIGIISSAKGYKLAWEVNHILGSRLTRQPDLTVMLNKEAMPVMGIMPLKTRLMC
jgi:hypothetical protein